jgi:hypothetical protein
MDSNHRYLQDKLPLRDGHLTVPLAERDSFLFAAGNGYDDAAVRDAEAAALLRRISAALTSLSQPVEFGRGAGEEGGPFGGGAAGGDALKGVPQYAVAATALVDRKVALEHCALGPKAATQVSM